MHLKSFFALALLATPIMAAPWAGRTAVNPTGSVQKVEGTFVVPTLAIPAGGSSTTTYHNGIWVGIDGTGSAGSCSLSQLAQTGVVVAITGTTRTCHGFYEYYPAGQIVVPSTSGFTCSPGDTIWAVIEATSSTTAYAYLENCTTGKTFSVNFNSTSGGTTHPLCQVDADWTLESDPTVLPDFDAVTFTNAIATLEDGTTVSVGTPTGSHLLIHTIKDASGNALTSSTSSGSSMTINYLG